MKNKKIQNLQTHVSWTQTFESLVSSITWDPKMVLGTSKASLLQQYEAFFKSRHQNSIGGVGKKEKDLPREFAKYLDKQNLNTPSPDERADLALQKEEFFNKEFDLFMHLVPNNYLTLMYREMGFGTYESKEWYRFGNSHHFNQAFKGLNMQMDNIIYCADRKTLFCNEIKLTAKKNPDQITKYVHLFQKLIDQDAIPADSNLKLCFISKAPHSYSKNDIDKEIAAIEKKQIKNEAQWFKPEFKSFVLELQKSEKFEITCTTWEKLIQWNNCYLKDYPVDKSPSNETLHRLINGFNETYLGRYTTIENAA